MHDLNEFSLVLPSNSSMRFFPNNTTTNFSTKLPREIELQGMWSVGLSEIHIPNTILHIRREDALISDKGEPEFYFPHGVYSSIQVLVKAINEAILKYNNDEEFYKITYDDKGGYTSITFYQKTPEKIGQQIKAPKLSAAVKRILGLEEGTAVTVTVNVPENENEIPTGVIVGSAPASLSRSIPDQLYVYSNLCEPCIVGDTHAPLLRIVNLEAKKFTFASTRVKHFAPITYVPLLNNRFQTVDIDIRDQFGNPIAFEFGTLTVTLHFKRDF